ncbi:carbohydrate kinase family protein [Aureimonas sp. Leaf324]|uniref:carbohydrate kinase family protein n=1 Tax=Aureimonas sp. Leaf324 TaxID=1736336 RepID=UPI0006F93631|nr:carbohydrate kinase family protein [Aureimonas sp. Leaf324]KQQ91067.1 ribokinase [Aureimonas sp. Leaf324]
MSAGQRRGFLTGGTWCADHNKLLDRWPVEETVTRILEESVEGGGSACNFGIDIRRLDPSMPVATIGCVGDDEDGRILLRYADDNGIDRTGMRVIAGGRTNYTDAYSTRDTGKRTHIFHQGTSALLSPDHFDFAGTSARIFHLGLPGIHDVMDNAWKGEVNGWVATLKAARAAGLETNFELLQIAPERLRELAEPCLLHLDTLVINDYEIGAITGSQTTRDGETDIAACEAAGRQIMERSSVKVLAIHFPRAAIAFTRDGAVYRHPSVNVPQSEVRGANGAGDAFAAGFMYGHHEGRPVPDCLKLAHASAAASLRSVGTTGSVETAERCLALADDWGWRSMPAA